MSVVHFRLYCKAIIIIIIIIIIHTRQNTLGGVITNTYNMEPSGPFDVAHTIIQAIYLPNTEYLAQQGIIYIMACSLDNHNTLN